MLPIPRTPARGAPVTFPFLEPPAVIAIPGARWPGQPEAQSTVSWARDPFQMPPPPPSFRSGPQPPAASSPSRRRGHEVQSTAPVSWAQDPFQMPPPGPPPPPPRPVADPTAASLPPRLRAKPYPMPPPSPSRRAPAQPKAASPAPAAVPTQIANPPGLAATLAKHSARPYRWPASSTKSLVVRPRCDQVAPPSADATDAWHHTSVVIYHPRRETFDTVAPVVIMFAPTHGPGLEGVALSELARGRGAAEPDTPVGTFLPPGHRWAGAAGRLVIEWPGYTLQTVPLPLKHDKRHYLPRAALGKAIASAVRSFIETFGDAHLGLRLLRLGPHRFRFEQLRLLEVISFDGLDFYLRVVIVPGPEV